MNCRRVRIPLEGFIKTDIESGIQSTDPHDIETLTVLHSVRM